ncbi:MAG: RAMP superfamily CRISPR-associated protein, partial [Acidimicrobiales bacterium]
MAPVPPRLGPQLRLRLRLDTDWHVGTGTGRPGGVDRMVRRDDDGLPYVPAKTLTGIWRDACEQVAAGLDDGGNSWSRLVTWIFGTEPSRGATFPAPAALSVRPARLSPGLRAALSGRPRLLEALTFVKPGVRIDPASGRALDRHLRFEEHARLGAVLHAEARLGPVDQPVDDALAAAGEALLVAGALLVKRLGGNRRRGAGRCTLTIVGAEDPTPWLDWLADHPQAPTPPQVMPAPAQTSAPAAVDPLPDAGESTDRWRVFPLRLRTLTPLIAPDRVRGNVSTSLDVVPGTLLLGALGRALAAHGVDLAPHLRDGELVVSDLVPSPDGSPAHPAPLTLARPKGSDDGQVVNRLIETPPPDLQVKPVRRGVVTAAAPTRPVVPGRVATTHATIDDARQRPTAEVGGVFTFEALPAGTVLTGELRVRGVLAERLETLGRDALLPPTVELGQSKKDDYGLAEVEILDPVAAQRDQWARLEAGERLVVWLQSDTLLVDDRHRPAPSLVGLQRTLESALGCRLRQPQTDHDRVVAAIEPVRRESWHAGWGLPRSALIGLKAGSVAVFELDEPLDGDRLTEIEHAGIGIRTGEGFGQVRFNHPALRRSATAADEPAPSPDGPGPLLGPDADPDDL